MMFKNQWKQHKDHNISKDCKNITVKLEKAKLEQLQLFKDLDVQKYSQGRHETEVIKPESASRMYHSIYFLRIKLIVRGTEINVHQSVLVNILTFECGS